MWSFITNKLEQVNLEWWEWVKIPEKLSFQEVSDLQKLEWNEYEKTKLMLMKCIKEWNLKDDEWNIPEINQENIWKLDVIAANYIWTMIYPKLVNENYMKTSESKKK